MKVNDAVDSTIARLRVLVDHRRHTAVRDRVLDESVWSFSQGAADVGLGLVLVVSAGAMARGEFAVGDLAVFTAYLGWLSFLPRMIGRMLARRKQAGVAFGRMAGLVADMEPDEERTRRPQHPSELGEHARHFVVRDVDDRPERDDAAQGPVVELKLRHRADLERRAPRSEGGPRKADPWGRP